MSDMKGIKKQLDIFISFFVGVGHVVHFSWQIIQSIFTLCVPVGRFFSTVVDVLVYSFPLVFFSCFFIGMVMGWEGFIRLNYYGIGSVIGYLIGESAFSEVGPVITFLLLAGRVGSSIVAKVSSMVHTEQMAAYKMMGVNPIRYVISPIVLGVVLSSFFMNVLGVVSFLLGGAIVMLCGKFLPLAFFWSKVMSTFTISVFFWSMSKAFIFSVSLSLTACYFGYHFQGGTAEIGKVVTRTVVTSSLLIFLFNFFITMLRAGS